MERSVGESPSSRVRAALHGLAGPLEVGAVAVAVIVTWRLTLGWNWSAVPTSDPFRHTAPQSGVDWVVFAIVVMAGVGWLGARGRAVAGTVAICAPIVLLSGWRMAASGVIEWPISLASLVFSLTIACMIAAALGALCRWRVITGGRRSTDESDRPLVSRKAGV